MSSNQQQGLFDPAREAWNVMKFAFFLFYRQLAVFMHWGYGARAFSFSEILFAQVLISVVATVWGGVGLSLYAALYTLLSLIHLGYRLSLTEEQLPHTKYDGEPWLLGTVIPYVEFSKKKYPVWFPEDSEIAIKMLEPLLFACLGYVVFDAGETKLGLYLMFVGLGALGATCFMRMEEMNDYYDKIDMLNRMRYEQKPSEEKQHHKGFKYAKPIKTETAKPQSLTEQELRARVQEIEGRARKPQAQAPPEAPDTAEAVSDENAPNPNPSNLPSPSSSSATQVVIFDNDAEPVSSNGNGTPKAPATITARVVRPPKAKKL